MTTLLAMIVVVNLGFVSGAVYGVEEEPDDVEEEEEVFVEMR